MRNESSYRLLLAAYPARLRRRHGPELITTMLELAGQQGRPSGAARRRLVLDGLGERLRPPARRPIALLAAVLALLVGGALGAAAGSWAGTLGYAALPDAQALGQRVLPAGDEAPLWSQEDSYFSTGEALPAGTDVGQVAEQTRRRLAAEGWQTGPVESGDGTDGILANVHFTAQLAGAALDVYAYPGTDGAPTIDLTGWPARPGAYVPLTIAGTLLGLVAGWLLGVALAHRLRAARRSRLSAALTATGLTLMIPSAAGFTASLLRYLTAVDSPGTAELVHPHGFAFGPTIGLLRTLDLGAGSSILTPGVLQQLTVWGLALIVVAAVLARPGGDRRAVA